MSGRRMPAQILTAGLTAAMMVAPFIAFLVRPEAGLVVMTLALVATTILLREAIAATPTPLHRWIRIALGINVSLAAACLAALVWLLLRP